MQMYKGLCANKPLVGVGGGEQQIACVVLACAFSRPGQVFWSGIPEVQEQTYKDKQCRNCGTALQSGDFLNKEAHTSYFHPCMYLADYAIAQLGAVSCSLDLQRLHEALWWVLGA
eukprot:914046-Pelagomonas_calceolata.AAC.2